MLGVSQDHDRTIFEVDPEARHLLEAHQKELEVRDIARRDFHHNNGMIRMLEKGDPVPPTHTRCGTMPLI